ncbi:hypothetical protein HPB47_002544 [Ixodes persulcatus]|uniref:Uncharacterized protein n=1 Tax=Ixodes persulcatus TaxID=34615 RepID=A0AC60PLC7_IXOPE|nr:hypothetical protein HPB47_002544 [Ixodes persulcatus]
MRAQNALVLLFSDEADIFTRKRGKMTEESFERLLLFKLNNERGWAASLGGSSPSGAFAPHLPPRKGGFPRPEFIHRDPTPYYGGGRLNGGPDPGGAGYAPRQGSRLGSRRSRLLPAALWPAEEEEDAASTCGSARPCLGCPVFPISRHRRHTKGPGSAAAVFS